MFLSRSFSSLNAVTTEKCEILNETEAWRLGGLRPVPNARQCQPTDIQYIGDKGDKDNSQGML